MKDKYGPFGSRNFRLYYGGQAISLIGTWMQQVSSAWLVLTISHSGTVLGLVVAAQTLPMLFLGPYGGLLADRVDKRRLLLVTQGILGSVSLLTGVLAANHVVTMWMLVALALSMGVTNSTANPARQSFVSELVDEKYLRSAVSLNSVLVNTARAIGPAIAGVLIATVGIQLCFFLDAASYLFVIVALLALRTSTLNTPTPTGRGKGQIRDGLRYVRSVQSLFIPLVMMVLIGTFAYEFQVLLPLVATHTFHGNAGTLGALSSAQGIGAICGGLYVARRGGVGIKAIAAGAGLFGAAMTFAALAPSFRVEIVAMFFVGASSIQFLSVGNSTLQLSADPKYRGRVMALWSMAFLGSTPIGGPIVGWIGQNLSPRVALGIGGLSCFAGALIGLIAMNGIKPTNEIVDTRQELSAGSHQDTALAQNL